MEKPIFISVLILAFFIIAGTLTTKALVTVKPGHVMVVERLGRYSRTLPAGFHWVIPFADNPRFITWPGRTDRINMIPTTQQSFTIPAQLQTKDGNAFQANVRILWRVEDPAKAAYATPILTEELTRLTTDTLQGLAPLRTWQEIIMPTAKTINEERDSFNGAEKNGALEEIATWATPLPPGRDEMQTAVQTVLAETAGRWGLVAQAEIIELIPSPELQQKMEQNVAQERAERNALMQGKEPQNQNTGAEMA